MAEEQQDKIDFIGPDAIPLLTPDNSGQKLKAIKRIAVSGVGFFSDAYDLFIINIVMVIMERIHEMTENHKSAISSAALWDKIGRKKGFICTLTLVIVGAIASASSFKTAHSSIFISLAIFRFILGVGIGGEYPLSATITAESSKTNSRGRMTSAVFSMQGIGSFVAALMGFTLIKLLGRYKLDLAWRLCLAFGAVPGILSMYFRITMEETDRFRHKHSVSYKHVIKTYWKTLMGTAGNWFLLDIVFYANGLFSSTVLQTFNVGKQEDVFDALVSTSTFNIYLTLMALPGYWVGIVLIELKFFGRRNTQIYGFILLGATYLLLGGLYTRLLNIQWLFVLIYGLTFFFTNAGANTTTFVIPSEAFPTEVRATCHGISAAAGKVGAVVGSAAMAPALSRYGLDVVFYICGGVALLGAVFTFIFTAETKGLSLEQIEDRAEKEKIPEGLNSFISFWSKIFRK